LNYYSTIAGSRQKGSERCAQSSSPIPEAYATAWIALHVNLGLLDGETVLVRGATSTVGQAAVNIAVDGGATVIATSRNESRRQPLRELGADEVLIDDGALRTTASHAEISSPASGELISVNVGAIP
jgi:NADPH:quinone reductase-like Zn-dependent oxidoreductase